MARHWQRRERRRAAKAAATAGSRPDHNAARGRHTAAWISTDATCCLEDILSPPGKAPNYPGGWQEGTTIPAEYYLDEKHWLNEERFLRKSTSGSWPTTRAVFANPGDYFLFEFGRGDSVIIAARQRRCREGLPQRLPAPRIADLPARFRPEPARLGDGSTAEPVGPPAVGEHSRDRAVTRRSFVAPITPGPTIWTAS